MTRERPIEWGIESTLCHGSNVVNCDLVTGLTCNPLVGAYLLLQTLDQLPYLEESLKRFKDPTVLVDLSVDLNKARILQIQQEADLLAEYVLIDLVRHFHQRCSLQNLKNWYQVWQGTVLRSRCDYIFRLD